MNLGGFLGQLLKSGPGALKDDGGAVRDAPGQGGTDRTPLVQGAAVSGALGMLLGKLRGRSVGGKVLKVGGAAAIGALAWKVYQEYQASQRAAAPAAAAGAPAGPAPALADLPPPQQEQHGRAMLKAMIAAAKSDGHMDERERGLVQAELHRIAADEATLRWVDGELRRPVDAADVAAAATTPELAAEVYLATLLVVDESTTKERAYLDELASQLGLAPALKADLERRAATPA
jgi:uncharacterized membrane protein YebE (DUF533 family)